MLNIDLPIASGIIVMFMHSTVDISWGMGKASSELYSAAIPRYETARVQNAPEHYKVIVLYPFSWRPKI